MVSSTSPFDSVAMFPSGCFYPPQMQPPKWGNDEATSRQPTNLDTKYDQTNRFAQQDSGKYSLENAAKYPLDFKCSQEMRWHPHPDFPCQLSFHPPGVPEAYPTDPFPSTSVALPNTFKMENSYYYPNAVIPPSYASPPVDCFTASQQFSQFKMPNVNAMNGVKMSGSSIPSSSSVPYRTGPGTNNVRVRTSEKYRMVYTDHQRLELEKEFHMTHFINAERKAQLSSALQLTERQIKIWFQNRRAKERRDSKKMKRTVA